MPPDIILGGVRFNADHPMPVSIGGTASISATGGTVAVSSLPAVSGTVAVSGGTAIIGKVGIDQTTPGTTNGVSLTTALAGEDFANDLVKVEQRFSPAAISTATTTVVKAGAGLLHRIVVTGGTAGTIVGYDNTAASGTKLFDFDSTNALGSYEFNVQFATGLTVVTGAATKVTVSYR